MFHKQPVNSQDWIQKYKKCHHLFHQITKMTAPVLFGGKALFTDSFP